jgi:hypothetical protein
MRMVGLHVQPGFETRTPSGTAQTRDAGAGRQPTAVFALNRPLVSVHVEEVTAVDGKLIRSFDDFAISKTLVTNTVYKQFVAETGLALDKAGRTTVISHCFFLSDPLAILRFSIQTKTSALCAHTRTP